MQWNGPTTYHGGWPAVDEVSKEGPINKVSHASGAVVRVRVANSARSCVAALEHNRISGYHDCLTTPHLPFINRVRTHFTILKTKDLPKYCRNFPGILHEYLRLHFRTQRNFKNFLGCTQQKVSDFNNTFKTRNGRPVIILPHFPRVSLKFQN